MSAYKSLNFFDEDSLLNEEELSIRNTARDFVSSNVIPLLKEAHRKEEFPLQLIPHFGKLGFLGSHIKDYGCAGLGPVAYGLLMEELERADSGIRSFCSVQGALAMNAIYEFGSDSQKEKLLPQMASGDIIGCFGLTEESGGSDPSSMKTKAERVSGGFKLNGSKTWITNGSIADIAVVWAKLEDEIRGFIVNKDTPGFSTTKMEGKFSLRVSVTSELAFNDCLIPEENILPVSKGLKAPLQCLTSARYGIAWGVIGAANACYDQALNFSKERKLFKKPLASFQLAQSKLVFMAQEITKARLLAIQLGRLKEAGKMTHWQVSMAKLNNCKMALDVARTARDMLGANGIIDEYPVIRHMLNLETVNTYEGTEDIHRLIVGQKITGFSAIE